MWENPDVFTQSLACEWLNVCKKLPHLASSYNTSNENAISYNK